MTRILPDALEPRPDPHGAGVLARERDVADLAAGRKRGLGLRHAVAFQLALLHLAMEVHLLGEIGLERALANEIEQAANELSHHASSGGFEDFLNRADETREFLALT